MGKKGYERLMSMTAKYCDIILQEWVDEHKMKRVSGEVKGDEDFIYVLLSLLDDNAEQLPDCEADTVIKAICLTLIVAAAETTVVTLTWAIALLLNNPEVLKKAQDELDIQVGTERPVNESDTINLVYLQAIIKETMRLYPAAPLLVPHESIEECVVNAYHVPAGTQLFVNAWKIQRDPSVWEEPCQFQPERFLTRNKDIDVRGQNFELIPFGSGRRMCPAVSSGLQVVQLTLASLVHAFDFTTPSDEPVDMGEAMGLTIAKATPLEVILSPRLSASLYGLWLTGGAISPYGRALFMMLHTSQKLNSAEKWDGLMASRAKINSPSLETMMSAMQKYASGSPRNFRAARKHRLSDVGMDKTGSRSHA
ncbi:hypothetical protein WN944_018147 [Citrus x changshan-huyou]|uniref:Cytochrome P450 n=1 Tax=Citrus x changshan-huyou TaxID=2935761 RepID=A0AAP0LSV1_9ROSI